MLSPCQAAESLNADDFTLMAPLLRLNDPIEALADPLVMVVLKTLGQDVPVKRPSDHSVKAQSAPSW